MKLSKNGLDFLVAREGLKLKAYQDSGGVWTIGIGTTYYHDIKDVVKKGDVITKEKAFYWFNKQMREIYEPIVKRHIRVSLSQNQYDALVSLAYNIGESNFKNSTFVKLINKDPNDPKIRDYILLYNKVTINGKLVFVQGLHNRRVQDANLYFSGPGKNAGTNLTFTAIIGLIVLYLAFFSRY